MVRINITEEIGKAVLESDRHLQECIAAGVNEPDRSSCRNPWGSVGFFLPPKKMRLTTTWRR